MEIKQAWYRVSVKAIIYNKDKDVLLIKESNWKWDFPGGWIDHWEDIFVALEREISEEMWLKIIKIDKRPIKFTTTHKPNSKTRSYIANIFYEVEVENLNYKKSDECVEIWFFNKNTIKDLNVIENVLDFFDIK